MPTPIVGAVGVEVVPSAEGKFQRRMAAMAEKAGRAVEERLSAKVAEGLVDGTKEGGRQTEAPARKQGAETGGAFATSMKRRIETALRSLPDIDLDADSSDADERIAAIRAELKTLADQKIGVDIDAGVALAQIERLTTELQQLEAESPSIQVSTDTAAAAAALGAVKRQAEEADRQQVRIPVSTPGATASLVGIAALSRAIRTLALPVAALAVTPYLLSLAASASQAVGSLALLPAATAAAGAAIGTLVVGFRGFGAVLTKTDTDAKIEDMNAALAAMPPPARQAALALRSFGDQYSGLTTTVQTNLFDGLAAPIRTLGSTYVPVLTRGMGTLAAALNGVLRNLLAFTTAKRTVADVGTIFTNTTQAVRNSNRVGTNLLATFRDLAVVGSGFLPSLATGFQTATQRLQTFINNARKTGKLREFIQRSLDVLGKFGTLAVNIGSMIRSLFRSAQAAGKPFLDILIDTTDRLATKWKTPSGAAQLTSFFRTIRGAVGVFLDRLRDLWPVITAAARAFVSLAKAATPVWLVLKPLFDLLRVAAPVLGPVIAGASALYLGFRVLGPAVQGLVLGFKALRAASMLLMSPWGLVIAAVAAVAAGIYLLATRTRFFQTIWSGIKIALSAVGDAFLWLWRSVIVPAWKGISTALAAAWSFMRPIFSAIGTIVKILAAVILTILITPVILAWKLLSAAIMWGYRTLIKPAFQQAGQTAQWLWRNVLKPVFGWIKQGWALLVQGIQWAWANILRPAWNAVRDAAQWLWRRVLQPAFRGIKRAWDAVLRGIDWAWQNILRPAWNAVRDAARFLYRGVIKPVMDWIRDKWDWVVRMIKYGWEHNLRPAFDAVKSAVDSVGKVFDRVVRWIRDTWAKLKGYARKPVQFVVDAVYNNGIRKVWNGIAGTFGLGKLDAVHFAHGGVLPGYAPGRDTVPAMLSPGEGVLTPEAVRAVGADAVHALNAGTTGRRGAAPAGHFAFGGIADAFTGAASWVMGGVKKAAGWASDIFSSPIKVIKDLMSGVLGKSRDTPGKGGWTDALKKLPSLAIDKIGQWVKDKFSSMFSGGGGGPQAGPIDMGGSQAHYARIIAQVGRSMGFGHHGIVVALMTALQESGLRNLNYGDRDSVGLFQQRTSQGWGSISQILSPQYSAGKFFQALRGVGGWRGMPYTVAAQSVQRSAFPNAYAKWRSTAEQFATAAGFDSGGLATGKGYLAKDIIQPERVLAPSNTASFDRLVASLHSGRVSIEGTQTAGTSIDGARIEGRLRIADDGLHAFVDGRIRQADQQLGTAILQGSNV